ncbi:MAG: tRNA (guanosine(46)-N7)-methyltransferase TrmB [Proteobacteria bacterium]|nr:tRNA (guanosine(46)-N7)-methyltransferase TrmB [Pseudomonadota bacterium]
MKEESQKLIRSFGRIKSRKLSEHKKSLLENPLKHYSLEFPLLKNQQPAILEIGFGFGDFIFEKAKKNPEKNFFGCEPHLNGVVNLLSKLEIEPLKNIQISLKDSRLLLEEFPEKFFDEIYILFPDPWPKTKHFKRRLLTRKFFDKILSPKIKTGGKLVIATDHDSYKTWILAEFLRSEKFSWDAKSKKDWQIFPKDWVKTKYQKKAEIESRLPIIFNLTHHD